MALASKPSQDFVPIKEVRDGIVILKDGGMRAVLMASSVNFALKSEDNQQAIILQFQNFLNSLDFSVQIFAESRRLDIRPYLALLEARYKEQTIELLKVQTHEYIEFIRTFTEGVAIMTKLFFVVIPYTAPEIDLKSGLPDIPLIGKKLRGIALRRSTNARIDESTFENSRTQLLQRVGVVEQGLSRMGLRSIQLGTEEVVELFYKLFNPGETEKPIQMS